MRRSLIVAFGALALFASSLAHAAEPDTIVTLKNGDVARGVLVERVTGDHVTIQLSTGESRTYPWNDVESVKPLSAAPPPASTQAPASPPAPSGASRSFRERPGLNREVFSARAPKTARNT